MKKNAPPTIINQYTSHEKRFLQDASKHLARHGSITFVLPDAGHYEIAPGERIDRQKLDVLVAEAAERHEVSS